MSTTTHRHGELRVWWIPQIPMRPFHWKVANVIEGKLLLDVLAAYDQFQFENRVKPDYANTGGLEVFDANDKQDGEDGSWIEWYSEDGSDIGDFQIDQVRADPPSWEMDGVS